MITLERLVELSHVPPPSDPRLHGFDPANPYYAFLAAVAAEVGPRAILELGTDKGDGACHFAWGAPSARVVTVDQVCSDTIRERCGAFPNIEVWTENTNDLVLPARLVGPFDILFIDTEHSFSQAWGEWLNYGRLVPAGGLVLFDDIHLHEGMEGFWKALPEPKVDLSHLHNTGFGALIKE